MLINLDLEALTKSLKTKQLILVEASDWNTFHAHLHYYEKTGPANNWQAIETSIPVVL